MNKRHYSPLDQLIMNLDQAVRTLAGKPLTTGRPNPSSGLDETELDEQERAESVCLMRVNHCGEVAAQGLYQGQALTARLHSVRESMEKSAGEENDHLDWCSKRVHELDGHLSYLNPLWYAGSFAIGAAAGIIGDQWSLGFVAETEKQVTVHLDHHLQRLSANDRKSRAILEQMRRDEIRHGETAKAAGGKELPEPVKKAMALTSRIMTATSYRI